MGVSDGHKISTTDDYYYILAQVKVRMKKNMFGL